MKILADEMERVRRGYQHLALIMVDLDHFSRLAGSQTAVAIAAVDLATAKTVYFTNEEITVDHVLASAAAEVGAGDLSQQLVVPDDGMVQMMTLDDGSTLIGKITEVGSEDVTFQTDLGTMTIAVTKIRDIKQIPEKSMKDSW